MEKRMSTYSKAEIRSAILRAASKIENGAPYDFGGQGVTGNGHGTKACGPCMWGHIGRELGLDAQSNGAISHAVSGQETYELYAIHVTRTHGNTLRDPKVAAKVLRAYADKYFPAEKRAALDKAYLAFRASLCERVSE
jgi:hypothetical protein